MSSDRELDDKQLDKAYQELIDNGSIFGDPVTLLLQTFLTLNPKAKVRIAYSEGLEDWPPGEPQTIDEVEGVFYSIPEKIESLPLESRDWTTGSLVSVIKKNNGDVIIVLDWESPIFQNIAVLLELLPRLISNPYDKKATHSQFTYRVSRQKLTKLFYAVMEDYYQKVLPVIMSNAQSISVLHNEYEADEIIFVEEDEDTDNGSIAT